MIDYATDKAAYFAAISKVIDWEIVNERFASAELGAKAAA
jgi:superoxide dismutase